MNREERKHRFTFSLLIAGVIFCFMFVSIAFSTVTGYLLLKNGIWNVFAPTHGGIILMMSANSLILGAIISAVAVRFPLKPINKIITQMNRLASGDYKARLKIGRPLSNHPTVKEITDSFNKMAEELDSTEMLRGDFINNFSHEFKTPIVSIAGFAKLLKRGNLTEEQRAEYVDIIEEESLRLASMATNILNLTKYENQTILSDVSEFNLSEQLRSSILELEGKWKKKNIEFNLDFSEHMISANKDMLRHVWINLIDNAIKFSESNSTVEISIRDTSDAYTVSVFNRGREITAEQQRKIFNKFYQADESHASEGNGIGLALVKRITELHEGVVEVSSENNSSTFTVTLPKKQS